MHSLVRIMPGLYLLVSHYEIFSRLFFVFLLPLLIRQVSTVLVTYFSPLSLGLHSPIYYQLLFGVGFLISED